MIALYKTKLIRRLRFYFPIPSIFPVGNFHLRLFGKANTILKWSLFLFAEIARIAKIKNQKLIQIHLFPSASCLKTFLWHGIRQYNFRTINKIIKTSEVKEMPILVCLGGPKSNSIHYRAITMNMVKKDIDKMYITEEGYEFSLAKAIKWDELKRKPAKASFYGLILQHNLEKNWLSKSLVSNKPLDCYYQGLKLINNNKDLRKL